MSQASRLVLVNDGGSECLLLSAAIEPLNDRHWRKPGIQRETPYTPPARTSSYRNNSRAIVFF